MKRDTRFRYSAADKALMWDRWQKGDSMNEIARHFGRYHSSIARILSENGGVRPAARKRSRLALTLAERGDLAWPGCGRLDTLDCEAVGKITVDHQPRGQSQQRSSGLSGE